MNINETKFTVITMMILVVSLVAMSNVSSATVVELVNPEKLPTRLHEGDQINLVIKIGDYEDAKSITIETSLILSGNTPIYDFQELNPSINENRYNSTVTLDTSSLPSKEFQVSIAGKAPPGEIRTKAGDTDIVISKFSGISKKFYEVRTDRKLADIKSFDLVINTKEQFTKTTEKITWKELDGIKREAEKLFDSGLTTEAQSIVNELTNIKMPDSLLLFGIVKIESDLLLNIIVVGTAIVMFAIGYICGRRTDDDNDNENENQTV